MMSYHSELDLSRSRTAKTVAVPAPRRPLVERCVRCKMATPTAGGVYCDDCAAVKTAERQARKG
jgi:hypothetical protein